VPDFGNNNFVVRINQEDGHFGSSENDINLANTVYEFAWLDFIMFNQKDRPLK